VVDQPVICSSFQRLPAPQISRKLSSSAVCAGRFRLRAPDVAWPAVLGATQSLPAQLPDRIETGSHVTSEIASPSARSDCRTRDSSCVFSHRTSFSSLVSTEKFNGRWSSTLVAKICCTTSAIWRFTGLHCSQQSACLSPSCHRHHLGRPETTVRQLGLL
jgi:hypothetical protein